MKIMLYIIIIISFFVNYHLFSESQVILEAAKSELERSMKELQTQPLPPYFISYTITEIQTYRVTASFGKIKNITDDKSRVLDIDIRVGNYDFDNTHLIRGSQFNFSVGVGNTELPIEDDVTALRSVIWYATDKSYKNAIESYEKALTNKAVKVQEDDTSSDFSKEKAYKYVGEMANLSFDKKSWELQIKSLSEKFNGNEWIYGSSVTFTVELQNKYVLNTEGTELSWGNASSRLMVSAFTKAEDGMSLPLYKSYFSFNPSNLPGDKIINKDIEDLISLLNRLRTAPLAEPFSGPAILSGEAAGVFFHEIFGHRVEGHREKDPNSSQTFKDKIGKKILPDFIDVVFDPTQNELKGKELSGYYLYDDEGIKSQKVYSVKNGIFKNFLMSRSPIKDFEHSNGHGRSQPGYKPVSRQSNLIVVANESVPASKLKDFLIEECKKQNKEYGLMFDVVQGGFTFTGRVIPNAFNVNPLVVYKIYADGRPDELVRGVDLIGTPLTTFSNIIKAGDDLGVFNGICGAESGGVPVSASSPSLLVSLMEVQRKEKSQAKLPILPNPSVLNKKLME